MLSSVYVIYLSEAVLFRQERNKNLNKYVNKISNCMTYLWGYGCLLSFYFCLNAFGVETALNKFLQCFSDVGSDVGERT